MYNVTTKSGEVYKYCTKIDMEGILIGFDTGEDLIRIKDVEFFEDVWEKNSVLDLLRNQDKEIRELNNRLSKLELKALK